MPYFNFSFNFNDPYFDFGGYRWAFRIFTPENTYGLDMSKTTLTTTGAGASLQADGLMWAGGQEKAEGGISVSFKSEGEGIEWQAKGWHGSQPVKSVAALVEGVPRGQIAWYDRDWIDPGDADQLRYYPFGGKYGSGMASPLMMIKAREVTGTSRALRPYWFAHVLDTVVRHHRFYVLPQGDAYHAEFVSEARGWEQSNAFVTPRWRLGWAKVPDEVYAVHQRHLESAFGMPSFGQRPDCPDWARGIQLVLNLHGTHWTGYVFNTFGDMLEILRWLGGRIDPNRVLVYLPAWNGRYYWVFPSYAPDPRMGGAEGFKRLVREGQSMGFKFMPMFGINCASRYQPSREQWANGQHQWPDGAKFWIEDVDWDNDRDSEKWQMLMNIGEPSWRSWLLEQVSHTISEYEVEAAFFDIAHFWINDSRYDMFDGTRLLFEELRRRHPGLLIAVEWWYDALMGLTPFVQGPLPPPLYPQAMLKYVRPFAHLSHPAPGRGSSGVHEIGVRGFDDNSLGLRPGHIPTLAIVDDTFDKHREVMEKIIEVARKQ